MVVGINAKKYIQLLSTPNTSLFLVSTEKNNETRKERREGRGALPERTVTIFYRSIDPLRF